MGRVKATARPVTAGSAAAIQASVAARAALASTHTRAYTALQRAGAQPLKSKDARRKHKKAGWAGKVAAIEQAKADAEAQVRAQRKHVIIGDISELYSALPDLLDAPGDKRKKKPKTEQERAAATLAMLSRKVVSHKGRRNALYACARLR